MTTHLITKSLVAAALLAATHVIAGPTAMTMTQNNPPADVAYEANRGLVTLTGPSGMFINPTSATLPQGAFTAQYCFFLPDFDFKGSIAHGALLSYGVTDWLEVGALALFLTDAPDGHTAFAAGPEARIRLLKHDGWIPQVSVGGYSHIGDRVIEDAGAFAALTERFEVKAGPVESVALHAGVRENWTRTDDSFRGYFGLEVQLPARIYVIGEVATQSSVDNTVPWSAGLQWRAGGINISTAALQAGGGGHVGFWFGIGTQF